MAILVVEFSKGGIQKKKGFWLKINCSQMKLPNFDKNENMLGIQVGKTNEHRVDHKKF